MKRHGEEHEEGQVEKKRLCAHLEKQFEWFDIDVSGKSCAIEIPEGAEHVRITRPGTIVWRHPPKQKITALMLDRVEIEGVLPRSGFSSVTHLIAIASFANGLKGYYRDNWIFPKHFPSLKYFWSDGCTPGMINYCALGTMGRPRLEQATMLECAYTFNLRMAPSFPCKFTFPVTRRVAGLGAKSILLRGSLEGWRVEIELHESPVATCGKLVQHFHYKAASDEERVIMDPADPADAPCIAWRDVATSMMLPDVLPAYQKGRFADVVIAGMSDEKVSVEKDKMAFVVVKALGELLGHDALTILTSLPLYIFEMDELDNPEYNEHVSLEVSSVEMETMQSNLRKSFEQHVTNQ